MEIKQKIINAFNSFPCKSHTNIVQMCNVFKKKYYGLATTCKSHEFVTLKINICCIPAAILTYNLDFLQLTFVYIAIYFYI